MFLLLWEELCPWLYVPVAPSLEPGHVPSAPSSSWQTHLCPAGAQPKQEEETVQL